MMLKGSKQPRGISVLVIEFSTTDVRTCSVLSWNPRANVVSCRVCGHMWKHCVVVAHTCMHSLTFARFDYRTFAVQTRARDRFSLDGLVTSHYPTTIIPCQSADGRCHGNGRRNRRLSVPRSPACVFIAYNNYKTNHHLRFFPLANHLFPDMFISFHLASITPFWLINLFPYRYFFHLSQMHNGVETCCLFLPVILDFIFIFMFKNNQLV